MKVSCIIPALNEEESIAKVVSTAKKCKLVDEVIVVDDGSSDLTAEIAANAGAEVVSHTKNRGKGAAMRTGAKKAKGNVLLFLDADLENIAVNQIKILLKPILESNYDFIKSSFKRERGRVTKLVALPLFETVFPWVKFKQPLSGQVAIKKRVFERMDLSDGCGVEVQMIMQAIKKKIKIKEVDIGKINHKAQSDDDLTKMSQEIISTILSETGLIRNKHKTVFFDLDKTLISQSSIEVFSKSWGFEKEISNLRKKLREKKIQDRDITISLARHFKGKKQEDVDKVCKKIRLTRNAKMVIAELRKRRYRVRIVSSAYSPIVKYFTDKLDVYDYYCPELNEDRNGFFTGELKAARFGNTGCCGLYLCKKKVVEHFHKLKDILKEEFVAIGDGKNDKCLFDAVGLSLAFKPKEPMGDIQIVNLSEALLYVE